MTEIFDWLYAFLARALAQPELAAVAAGLLAGIGMTYLVQRLLPWDMKVSRAELIGRVVIFFTVMGIGSLVYFTPRSSAWLLTVALMAPLVHEALFGVIYHKFPWLQPKALMTADELQTQLNNEARRP